MNATLVLNQTEIYTLLSALDVLVTEIPSMETPATELRNKVLEASNQKVVKNLLSGKDCIIDKDTPLCCDPSSETFHSM